jgi:hypothetical protein
MRTVTYTLRGVEHSRTVTRPVATQLALWLERTYRVHAEVYPA